MRKQAPIYKLKISIKGAPYPLWRRIIVRGDDTLLHLHGYIMQVMEFSGYHLWNFDTAFGSFSMEEDFSTGYLPPDARRSKAAKANKGAARRWFADNVAVMDVAGPKTKFLYTYDFGDGWEHNILVEDVAESFPKVTNEPPYCLGGKGEPPREGCGGVWMLRSMVKAWTEIQELKKQGVELSNKEIKEKYGEIIIPYSDERPPRCVHPSYALTIWEQARSF